MKTYFLCGDQSAYSVTLLFTVSKVLYKNIMKNVNLALKIQFKYINMMLSCIKCFNLNLTFLNILTLCKLGKFSCFSCCLLHLYMYIASRFFNKKNPKNSFKNTIRIILLVLIWIQTVCKGYQQMTKVPASNERVQKTRPG